MQNGKTLRDEGIALVLQKADDSWKEEAYQVIETLANKGPFTSDDVWANLSTPPHHGNAIGAVILHAAKRFNLKRVDYKPSERPSSRHHVLAVWDLA